jgi:hypothetical protein
MNTAPNDHSAKRRNVEKKLINRKVNTQITMMSYVKWRNQAFTLKIPPWVTNRLPMLASERRVLSECRQRDAFVML